MFELFGIALDAVGFGLGLLSPFIIAWAWEKRQERRKAAKRRRREILRERGVAEV